MKIWNRFSMKIWTPTYHTTITTHLHAIVHIQAIYENENSNDIYPYTSLKNVTFIFMATSVIEWFLQLCAGGNIVTNEVLTEVQLLLVENFNQYPVVWTWNTVRYDNFWKPERANNILWKENWKWMVEMNCLFEFSKDNLIFQLVCFCLFVITKNDRNNKQTWNSSHRKSSIKFTGFGCFVNKWVQQVQHNKKTFFVNVKIFILYISHFRDHFINSFRLYSI